jgi:hypothetical protein
VPYTVRATKASSIIGIRVETAAMALKVARDLRNDGFTDPRIINNETWEDHDEDILAQTVAGEQKSQTTHVTPDPAEAP